MRGKRTLPNSPTYLLFAGVCHVATELPHVCLQLFPPTKYYLTDNASPPYLFRLTLFPVPITTYPEEYKY